MKVNNHGALEFYADEIEAAEQEAIVPNPMIVESDALSIEEKALRVYFQVYEITGDEREATTAYWKTIQTPHP